MAVASYTIPLTQTVNINGNSVYAAVTSGTFALRVNPFSSATYPLSYLGDGVWAATNVEDGVYQLWNATTQLTKFGTFWIGDTSPTLTALTVNGGNIIFTNSQFTLSGATSFNMAGNDLANGDHIQCNTVGEATANQGVIIDGIRLKDNLTSSNIPSLSGANNQFVHGNTFFQYPLYGGTSEPTIDNQFVTLGFVNNAILSVPTLTGNFHEAPNVVRLIPNGVNESGKVYSTWVGAQAWADSYVNSTSTSASKRATIMIPGEGNAGVPIDWTGLTSPFISKVNYTGYNQNIRLDIPDDTHVVNVGTVIIDTLTFQNHNSDSSPVLQGFTFTNCVLWFLGDGLGLTNCIFRGLVFIKTRPDLSTTLTLNSCSGAMVFTNKTPNYTGNIPTVFVDPTIM